ncbi:hypothetical protein Pyn_24875 [Prunus yedoensis var. nudiflora]|uniref:Bet v I/Major latex protein domain-containing protein n=1 Tax=Prunus yedoensis var. nudiflora TaxID=2094558 RepID=A0A314UWL1_PRUYE|nr:hypothetical protein Pyn_24875 [Prunus yedoensis var. nudiflora]
MALVGKLDTEVEMNAPADKFRKYLRAKLLHLLPNVSSNKVQGVELHEGDWETAGSVKHWDNIIPWGWGWDGSASSGQGLGDGSQLGGCM